MSYATVPPYDPYYGRFDQRLPSRRQPFPKAAGFTALVLGLIVGGALLRSQHPANQHPANPAGAAAPVRAATTTPPRLAARVLPPRPSIAAAATVDPALFDPALSLGPAPQPFDTSRPLGSDFVFARAVEVAVVEGPAPTPTPAAPPPPTITLPTPPASPVVENDPVPLPASPVERSVPLPEPRPPAIDAEPSAPPLRSTPRRLAMRPGPATPAAAPAPDGGGFLDKFFGMFKPSGPALGYAAPESGLFGRIRGIPVNPTRSFDHYTAVYDISAHTVYMPDGTTLEAHSGLGSRLDDPSSVAERNRGATPPQVYDLQPREQLFHGVQALRLNPLGGGGVYGRVGLLAHTYMLGPKGDSNGCVSFRNYNAFLEAYKTGQIRRLAVVTRL